MLWLRRGVFHYVETRVGTVTFSTAERPPCLCLCGGRGVCFRAHMCVCTCERMCDSVCDFVCTCARTHMRIHHKRCKFNLRCDHVYLLYINKMYPSLCLNVTFGWSSCPYYWARPRVQLTAAVKPIKYHHHLDVIQ